MARQIWNLSLERKLRKNVESRYAKSKLWVTLFSNWETLSFLQFQFQVSLSKSNKTTATATTIISPHVSHGKRTNFSVVCGTLVVGLLQIFFSKEKEKVTNPSLLLFKLLLKGEIAAVTISITAVIWAVLWHVMACHATFNFHKKKILYGKPATKPHGCSGSGGGGNRWQKYVATWFYMWFFLWLLFLHSIWQGWLFYWKATENAQTTIIKFF